MNKLFLISFPAFPCEIKALEAFKKAVEKLSRQLHFSSCFFKVSFVILKLDFIAENALLLVSTFGTGKYSKGTDALVYYYSTQ